jgi:hypothetical protein
VILLLHTTKAAVDVRVLDKDSTMHVNDSVYADKQSLGIQVILTEKYFTKYTRLYSSYSGEDRNPVHN